MKTFFQNTGIIFLVMCVFGLIDTGLLELVLCLQKLYYVLLAHTSEMVANCCAGFLTMIIVSMIIAAAIESLGDL